MMLSQKSIFYINYYSAMIRVSNKKLDGMSKLAFGCNKLEYPQDFLVVNDDDIDDDLDELQDHKSITSYEMEGFSDEF